MSLMMPQGFLTHAQPPPTKVHPLNLEFSHLSSFNHSPKSSPRNLMQHNSMPRSNGPQESYFGLSPRGNRENPGFGQNLMGVSPFQAATQNILPVYYMPVVYNSEGQPQPLSYAIQNHNQNQLYGAAHLDRMQSHPQQPQNNGIQREMTQLSQLNKELRDLQMKNQRMSRARSDYGTQFLASGRASLAIPRPEDVEKGSFSKRGSLLMKDRPERDEVVQFGQNLPSLPKAPLLANRLDKSTDHSSSPKFMGNTTRPRFNPSFDTEEYGPKPTEVSNYGRGVDPNSISQFFKRKENRLKSQFDGNHSQLDNSAAKSPLLSAGSKGSKGKKDGGDVYDFDMGEFNQKLPPIQQSPSLTRKTSQKFYPVNGNDMMLREILVKNRNRNSDMEAKASKYSFDAELDGSHKDLIIQKTRSSRQTKVLLPEDLRSLDNGQRNAVTEKSEEPRDNALEDILAQSAKNHVRTGEKKMSLMGSFYPQMMSPKSTFSAKPQQGFNFKVMADLHQKHAAAMLSEEEDKRSTKEQSPKEVEEEAQPVKEKKKKRPVTKKKLRVVKRPTVAAVEHETPLGTLDELDLSVGSGMDVSQSYEKSRVSKGKRV